MSITYKDEAGIAGMRVAGKLASELLDYLTPHVVPGVTTDALDKLAHDYIVNVQGAIPAPLNYAPRATSPTPRASAPRSTTRSATASRTRKRSRRATSSTST
ncbi:Methionine aminopeptidase [Hydrogenophaga sp. T4]|nr:Methionine aminopeptidase [Hydrogenophaga sp. T4]